MNIKILPADRYFSLCVRKAADWTCQASGKRYEPGSGGLHCAHIVSRRHRSLRWHPLNALALSFGEHAKYDEDPHYHIDYSVDYIGKDNYEWLIEQKRKIVKFSKAEVKQIGKFYKDQAEIQQPFEPVPICPIVEDKLNG